ncbi:MAG TPA: sigma-E factor negative regulatory protein [Burkholderiaceae bacterium]|nr:sigma-E factor negative regulatory protein [Burkholderiaceae bacterium]
MNEPVNSVRATASDDLEGERLSAAVDGEGSPDELAAILAGLRQSSPDTRWSEYHLIGDLLRSTETPVVRPRFSAAVMARLEDEPTVMAPVLLARRRRVWVRWGLPGASVAAAAALIWVAVPRIAGTGAEPAVVNAAAGAAASSAQQVLVAQEAPLPSEGVDRYLIAHQQVSPSANRHGIAPMTRAVSYPAAPVSQR